MCAAATPGSSATGAPHRRHPPLRQHPRSRLRRLRRPRCPRHLDLDRSHRSSPVLSSYARLPSCETG